MAENHSERNRRRREKNAFRNLYGYAQAAGVADPKRTAEKTARAIHIEGGPLPAVKRDPPAPKSKAAPASAPAPKSKSSAPAAKASAPAAKPSTPAAAEPAAEEAPVPHRLDDRTREQLYARAQELEIEGRSQMTKAELIEAIRAAS